MTDTIIDIIRHGEPVGGRRYRGHGIDDALSPKGWQQMWDSVPQNAPWQHIISSPLTRCHEFSQALAESLNINFSIDDNLKEIGFGVWEGCSPDEIKKTNSDALDRFLQDPVNNRPEGAEPLDVFSQRVNLAYQNIIEKHQGQHVLIVAHAGVIRAITSRVLGMSLDNVYSSLKIDYAAIATTRIDENGNPLLILK